MSQQEQGGASKAAHAAKAAKIARGLAVGGIKGGLFEAAKEYAPQLTKFAVVCLTILIFLPWLVIAAIPNVLFQFESTDSEDVQEMTDKAKVIENAYKSALDSQELEVDRILAELAEGYDDIEILKDFDRINQYWFIAITSVAHNQDLFIMEEEQIKLGFFDKIINFFFAEEEYEETDGDVITTLKRLKVTVTDLEPEQLMDELGFTEEQKNWAAVIYNTICDDQTRRPGDPFYDGNLYDYGDIVFRDGETDVVYYNQADSKWGKKLYGKYDTIAAAGCGPSSLAIVVSSLTDRTIDPGEMSDWAYKNGYRCEGSGSYHSLIPEGGRHFGLTVEGATASEGQKIVDALSSGKLVVAIMGPGSFTKGGHFIVLRGVTADGKILVADPGSYSKSEQEWSLRLILSEARKGAAAGGPFWICSA